MILLIIVPCVLCCAYAWRRRRLYLRGHLPPVSCGAWPVVGHSRLWVTGSFWRQILSLQLDCLKQGGVTYLYSGTMTKYTYYALCDPEVCSNIANTSVERTFLFETTIRAIFGNGLVTCEAGMWEKRRITLEAVMSDLSANLNIANQQSGILVDILSAEVGKGAFDQIPYIKKTVMSILFRTVFAESKHEKVVIESTDNYMQAMEQMSSIIYDRHNSYIMHNNTIYNWSNIKRRQDETIRNIEHVTIKNMNDEKGLPDFFRDLVSKGVYTEEDLVKEIITLIFSGYGTISNGLIFILVMLGSHKIIQEKVYLEIQQVFGGMENSVEIEDMSKLKLLEAVILETLRLYPPVTTITRGVSNKTKLKTYPVETGTKCLFFIYALNRHPIWGDNREKFIPERWLDKDFLYERPFATFGLGKRDCIGKILALNVMKTVLVHLLRKYIVSANHSEMKIKQEFYLIPESGHFIALQQRS